ncbi:ParB N-terminal domain-containing protein [Rhizobium calliandrae]|uniref:ParB N-terminal domain-containing protein n=1 Tax=Rhizobium calliandrae TaxID=1312182 RepID=A0ABT7KG64_9HYPH|nr:ParB N-terminal domain-containing protein [Rhizobium calliandrae]MDL2407611.1 ParB N-terminal domain-containing protein [Rhizobium calliandrae]
MQLMKVDPRALKDNPDNTRQSKSTPQADALLLATIRAVGVIQPPVIFPEAGGNGYIIEAGHRRTRMAVAAGLEEIDVIVVEAANDNGAMRSMVENIAREPLNPVDQWRGIERLVALAWTEEAITVALALPVRQIRKLRLLANVLPSMLDQMAKGDMPNEQQLRTIAAASAWWQIANGLSKTRMYARDASFGDDLRLAYGIEWAEDLFGPADEDNRYTTNVEAFLGAQQEWMTSNLPKKGAIVELNNWGQPDLPKKAERIYGKPAKGDCTAMYLDRDGKVQSVHYRMPEVRKPDGRSGPAGDGATEVDDEAAAVGTTGPDVTQKGQDMVGDFRTEALARTPIEDDMLMALLVMAFAGTNGRVDSAANDTVFGPKRFQRHVARLFSADGRLSLEMDNLRIAARSVLIDVLSCRRGMSNSGAVSRIAGEAIGADGFLPNMGTEDFLLCLSRQALEAAAKSVNILPRARVRETRAALVDHFASAGASFVLPAALFQPDPKEIADLMKHADDVEEENGPGEEAAGDIGDDIQPDNSGGAGGSDLPDLDGANCGSGSADNASDEDEAAYGIAAE